jgi:DNA-binding IscR family transcriptional regulator
MARSSDQPPFVDAQALTDLDAYVYEAIATLEYSGRPVTSAQIVAATDLDDQTASEVLDDLTERGVLVRTQTGEGDAYDLARRDWSAAPDTPSR